MYARTLFQKLPHSFFQPYGYGPIFLRQRNIDNPAYISTPTCPSRDAPYTRVHVFFHWTFYTEVAGLGFAMVITPTASSSQAAQRLQVVNGRRLADAERSPDPRLFRE